MNRILGKSFSLLVLCLISTMSLAAVDIIVRSDRNPVHMDESFQLVFEANGSVDDDPDFSPLQVLLDVMRQSESSNISLINGSMSRSKTWTLTVMAKALGDIQIPSIHFGDDKSPPFLIKVKKADQAQMGSSSFFVNLETDVKSGIEQAQIVATVRVFSDKSLNEISIATLQFNHTDVMLEMLGEEKSFQTKIQGKNYLVIEQKVAIFPQDSGVLEIHPVLAVGEVRVGGRRFFGDPAGQPVRARSNALKIDVKAKPDVPVWLPSQLLKLQDQWLSDPAQFTVGEPITRVLTLTAKGLTSAQLPELEIKAIDFVKQYPDQVQLKDDITDSGIVGIRQEKIAYIPSEAGEFILPSMLINWWNTRTGQWQKAQIAEQVITVKQSESFVEQTPVLTQTPVNIQNKELNKSSTDEVTFEVPSLKSSEPWWKFLTLFFALAWIITLWLFFKKSKPEQTEVIIEEKVKPIFKMSELKTACSQKDAKGCKSCVINWANDQFMEKHFTQLSDLKHYVDDTLYKEIKQLEATLYATESSDEWEPDHLYAAIISANSTKKGKDIVDNKKLVSLRLS